MVASVLVDIMLMVTLDNGHLHDHNLNEAPLHAACFARVPGDVVAMVATPWCSLETIPRRHLDTLAENWLLCARPEHAAAATDGHTIHCATATDSVVRAVQLAGAWGKPRVAVAWFEGKHER